VTSTQGEGAGPMWTGEGLKSRIFCGRQFISG
jgi:hypothetical protein